MSVITVPVGVVALLAAGTTFIVTSNLILYMMIGQVNRKLPENQQIPYFFSFSYPYVNRMATIKREYKRFYPGGCLQMTRTVLNVLGFVLMAAGAWHLSHFWR